MIPSLDPAPRDPDQPKPLYYKGICSDFFRGK